MRFFRVSLCFLFALILSMPAPSQELGYRRITMKERLKEFYRTNGKKYRGKKVHITIPAEVFRKKPDVIRRPGGTIWHVFANRSVPVIVSPKNLYLKRIQKELSSKRKKIKTISVFGRIKQPTWDVKGRCHLYVHKMKSYGGALMKTGG